MSSVCVALVPGYEDRQVTWFETGQVLLHSSDWLDAIIAMITNMAVVMSAAT